MIYVGTLLIVLSLVVYYFSRRKGALVAQMQLGRVVPINQLKAGMQAEVYGNASAAQPLLTPFSHQPCVFYEYEVTRQVEARDSGGQTIWRQERVHSDRQSTVFSIQDQTGSVAIYPDAATVDAQSLGERPLDANDSSLSASIAKMIIGPGGSLPMVQEKALLVNQPVYVFGMVSSTAQGLSMIKGNGELLVSYRTEAEAEKAVRSSKRKLLILASALAVVGLALTVWSIVH